MSSLPQNSEEDDDIFSLFSQINFINNQIENTSINKINEIFRSKNDLIFFKKEISQQLEHLLQHASTDIKQDVETLNRQWNFVKSNLYEEDDISNLLQKSIQELKQQMDGIYEKKIQINIHQEADFPDRITSAVTPFFQKISEKTLEDIEEKYPNTINALLNLALHINAGQFGEKLRSVIGFTPDAIQSFQSLLLLLLFNSNNEEKLEIIKENPIKKWSLHDIENYIFSTNPPEILKNLKIPLIDQQALLQIFHKFVAHLLNPSHYLIDLLIEKKQLNKAIDFAMNIPQDIEQSKSLLDITQALIKEKQTTQAIGLVLLIKHNSERDRALAKIIEHLIGESKTEQALELAKSLSTPHETDRAFEEIAINLTKNNNLTTAYETIKMISDPDVQAYTLSRIANILSSKGNFQQAQEIALSIKEPGFREDAFSYIIKKLLNHRQINQALKLVESIQNPKEKNRAAKIIENAMLAHNQDEKIKHLLKGKGLRPSTPPKGH